jgi:transcriptional regulator with XRE-family HTH domain
MASKTSKIIADLRKSKNWSQAELATNSGVSREMIGKYERSEAVLSIDAAKKIADAFEVSMDYLVGEGINVAFDKKNLKRLQEIEKPDTDVKDKIYFVIDNIIQNVKAKKALAS